MPLRIAVVGGGVAGLGATWALNEHSPHDVHLFEAGDYVGGHTHTVEFHPPTDQPGGERFAPTWVDTGFIVFNEVTYPNFLRFIKHVGVRIIESDMSFAVTRTAPPSAPRSKALFSPRPTSSSPSATKPESPLTADAAGLTHGGVHGQQSNPVHGQFEWAGTSPIALFCQWTNLLDPNHWRMVWDIIRFNYQALQTLREEGARRASDRNKSVPEESIGEWIEKRGYGDAFIKNYLIPMTASIWSTPPTTALSEFPAITLLRFCHNHHLLQILDRPRWLTLHHGSHNYVKRVVSHLPPGRLNTGPTVGKIVRAERRRTAAAGDEWILWSADGAEHVFDRVIFATHANTSLEILNDQLESDDVLRTALAGFLYSKNRAVLHADTSLMPVRKAAWAAWNFLAYASESSGRSGPTRSATQANVDVDQVSLTYWMNLLQSLPISRHGPVLVTLNPPQSPSPYAPAEELVVGAWEYEHPVYSARTVASQNKLSELQGSRGVYFAGAWIRYGFHEDGFSAGLRAAEWCAASERGAGAGIAGAGLLMNGNGPGSVHGSQQSIDEDGPLGLTNGNGNGNGSIDPTLKLPFDPRPDAERTVPRAGVPELVLLQAFLLVEFLRRHVFGPAFLGPLLIVAIWANLAVESALNLVLVLLGKGVIDVERHVRGSAIRASLREVRAGWEKARDQVDAVSAQSWTAGRP